MRVTLAQISASTDRVANIEVLRDAAVQAARESSDLLVLPEYANAFDPRGVGPDLAETSNGSYIAQMRRLSREHELWIIAGVTLLPDGARPVKEAPAGRAHNTIVVTDPQGRIATRYDKVHLYDAFGSRESDRLLAGDPGADPAVVTIADVNVGIMTCYDLRFPESARRLVDADAQIMVVPAAWAAGPGKVEHWSILARARALENVSVVLAVGMCGKGVIGNSIVATPDGSAALQFDDRPQLRTVDIDSDLIAQARHANPSLNNRRYRVIPAQ